jgi:hypothetical protein
MNRDQWTLKMKREELRLVQTGAVGDGSVKWSIFDKRAGGRDRRAMKTDRRRGVSSRQATSAKGPAAVRLAEKYGACCEWGLPVKVQKR